MKDRISIRATSEGKVAVHRVRPNGFKTLVGYFSSKDAEAFGVRLIQDAGRAKDKSQVPAK